MDFAQRLDSGHNNTTSNRNNYQNPYRYERVMPNHSLESFSNFAPQIQPNKYFEGNFRTRKNQSRETKPFPLNAYARDQLSKPDIYQMISPFRIHKTELIAYAAKFIEKTFSCDSNPPRSFSNPVLLSGFLTNIMNRTRINTCTLAAAFFYLQRLKKLHPRCKGSAGSGHRLFLASIILAAKYMYDDTFDNTAWATVSSGLFLLDQVNHMEREMLIFLDFRLYIKATEWNHFMECMLFEMSPQESFNPVKNISCSQSRPTSSSNTTKHNPFSSFPNIFLSRQDSATTIINDSSVPAGIMDFQIPNQFCSKNEPGGF